MMDLIKTELGIFPRALFNDSHIYIVNAVRNQFHIRMN